MAEATPGARLDIKPTLCVVAASKPAAFPEMEDIFRVRQVVVVCERSWICLMPREERPIQLVVVCPIQILADLQARAEDNDVRLFQKAEKFCEEGGIETLVKPLV